MATWLEELILSAIGGGDDGTGIPNLPDFSLTGLPPIDVYTPASDFSSSWGPNRALWGRTGNDYLLETTRRDSRLPFPDVQFTLFGGDIEFPQLVDPVPRDWENQFIIGDWVSPFFAQGDLSVGGLNDIGIIGDFDPLFDTIQLHGSPSDYSLQYLGNLEPIGDIGVLINYNANSSNDLGDSFVGDAVAIVIGAGTDLSLDKDYFRFSSSSPPAITGDSQTFFQTGTREADIIDSVSIDSDGNTIIAGYTTGSFGQINQGERDIFLLKLDPYGNTLYETQLGSAGTEALYGMDVDDDGNVYVTGSTTGDFVGDIDFINIQAWLAKFDKDGRFVWKEPILNPSGKPGNVGSGSDVVVAPDGRIHVAGVLNALNEEVGFPPLRTDNVLAIYTPTGEQVYYDQIGSSGPGDFDDVYALAVDNSGNTFRGGFYTRPEPEKSDFLPPLFGLYDVYLFKTSPDGSTEWRIDFGTNDYDWLWKADTDSFGNVYVGGWTLGAFEGTSNLGSFDAWIAKYSSSGEQLWLKQFGSTDDDVLFSLKVDNDDNVITTGYTAGSFGTNANQGGYDFWAVKFDSYGNELFNKQYGSSFNEEATDIGILDNSYQLIGYTDASLGSDNLGSLDIFLAEIDSETGNLIQVAPTFYTVDEIEYNRSNGTASADFLTGTNDHNLLYGYNGDDTLLGSGKFNAYFGGGGSDFMVSSEGIDAFVFPTLIDTLYGDHDTVYSFNTFTDYFVYPQYVGNGFASYAGKVAELSANSLTEKLDSSSFLPYSVAMLEAGQRSYIVFNDSNPGFQSGYDGLLEVTGYSGCEYSFAVTNSILL